jgi:hypothetical protein
MKTLTAAALFTLFFLLSLPAQSQCLGLACDQPTIQTPPYIELSVGQGIHDTHLFYNVTHLSISRVTKGYIVYGLSFGVRPTGHPLRQISTNVLLGYNVAGCIILAATVGATNITTMRANNEAEPVLYTGWHANAGMTVKFISGHTTFGAYGSSTGIGLSLGLIVYN